MNNIITPNPIYDFRGNFPYHLYKGLLPNQEKAFDWIKEILEKQGSSRLIMQLPTASGKSVVGYTYLRTLYQKMQAGEIPQGPLFYITPKRTLIRQLAGMFSGVAPVYGRGEYECLYYGPDHKFKANEIPCALLKNCKHRVNQTDGSIYETEVQACPFLLDKFHARQAPIVACSMSFYILTQLIHDWPKPQGLVIDEAHTIINMARATLSSTISDWHLQKCIELLETVGMSTESCQLQEFQELMIEVIRSKPEKKSVLLEDEEITQLLEKLKNIDSDSLERQIRQLISSGEIDTLKNIESLKQLEVVGRDIQRYIKSFGFALPAPNHGPLNFICGHYEVEKSERKKVQHLMKICTWHVPPLLRGILAPHTLAFSATMGNPTYFTQHSGVDGIFYSLPSDFPPENTRIFLPTDILDLSYDHRKKRDVTNTLRRIVKACSRFAYNGIRSLVIVVSEVERQEFLRIVKSMKLHVVTYGEKLSASKAMEKFKSGEGDVLLGTSANYGEGADLPYDGQPEFPDGMAPVIFDLRPAFPDINSPTTQFEMRRYGKKVWSMWTVKVENDLHQVVSRNVRSRKDKGVSFLMSRNFEPFARKSLPEWKRSSYCSNKKFEECVQETFKLLGKEEKMVA